MWCINRYICVVAFQSDQITSANELIRRGARRRGTCGNWSAVKPTPERFTTTRINRNPDLNPGNFTSRAQFSLQSKSVVNLEGNLSAVSLGQDGGSVTSSPVGQPACGFCPNYTDSTSSQIYNRAPDIKVQHSLVLLPFCVYCSGLGGV